MRALFFGTPAISVPSLDALTSVADVVGVVCQPDRPSGRGMKLTAPAVKVRAEELGLEVFQPEKVKDGALRDWMREKQADVALVIAYGRILNEEVLSVPRLGCVNLHASLLPKYRGAAPIQRAIMAGETETGVCLMQMDVGMDTGAVLSCHRLSIGADDTTQSLGEKLGSLAARVTTEDIPRLMRGELNPTGQDEAEASYASPITRDDCPLNFARTSVQLAHQVRGLHPRPGATAQVTSADGKQRVLRILRAQATESGPTPELGQIVIWGKQLYVGTGAGALEILEAQLEGKKALAAADLINGRSILPEDTFG